MKASGGMSLLERIARDELLRHDLLTLLKELEATPSPEPLAIKGPSGVGRKKLRPTQDTGADADMLDVPIVSDKTSADVGPNVLMRVAKPIDERWNDE